MVKVQSTIAMLVSVQLTLWFTLTWQVLVTSTRTTTLTAIQLQFGYSSWELLSLCSWFSWTCSLQLWVNLSEESPPLLSNQSWKSSVPWWMTTCGSLIWARSSQAVATSCGWLQVPTNLPELWLSAKLSNSALTLKNAPMELTTRLLVKMPR